MPQKLVSIYLNSEGYRVRGQRAPEQCHGAVQEHLSEYLKGGWKIVSISVAAGATGDVGNRASGWVFVLLEK